MSEPEPPRHEKTPPLVIKKYANRRLYNTESSSYITLDILADMVRAGRDFVVYDAKTGDDITRSVLTQIIVDEENKGRALLPTGFLRQLIGLYGEGFQGLLPGYLEQAMTSFAEQQQQIRRAMQQTVGTLFPGVEEMSRRNLAMMEQAMSLFSPFQRAREAAAPAAEEIADREHEIAVLRAEVAALRAELGRDATSAKAKPGETAKPATPSAADD
jgi:polyhydroxyalkanoate synthesis repressor PhaR